MKLKKIRKAITEVNISETIDTTKRVVKNSNEFALDTTEELINESLTIIEQWQKVTVKAINGGFKLASNQQDLVFDALELVKGQYKYGRKKVTKLLA